jgi:CubicO group peptidase (beta-lactamase class C family)
MRLDSLFEEARQQGLFTDYDVCVEGSFQESFSGGPHVAAGAELFDVASLTKACTHLLYLKLFDKKIFSPDQPVSQFLPVRQHNGDERELWHFLCYLVQDYAFTYGALKEHRAEDLKSILLNEGFHDWGKTFRYDNVASVYLGLILERKFGRRLDEVFRSQFELDQSEAERFLFHPAHAGGVPPELIVPTSIAERGRVHDPFARTYEDEILSVAGLFSTAKVLAGIFHREIDRLVKYGWYDQAAANQLPKLGITRNSYGLGFDIPFAKDLQGFSVEGPLVFAGFTGCRLFFTKRPRLTVCFLTNRVLHGDTEESRRRLTEFSWGVIRAALKGAD